MAAGDSIVSICNIALRALGEESIVSLTDPYKAAILCNERYDAIRREVLCYSPWSFAKRRAGLPASTKPPAFGYGQAFPLPADYLRLIDIHGFDDPKYEEEDGQILCDYEAPLRIRYVYDIQDPTRFSPVFVAALGYAIAEDLAISLCQDLSKRQLMTAALKGKLDLAALVSSQSQSSPEFDDDVLLRSRA